MTRLLDPEEALMVLQYSLLPVMKSQDSYRKKPRLNTSGVSFGPGSLVCGCLVQRLSIIYWLPHHRDRFCSKHLGWVRCISLIFGISSNAVEAFRTFVNPPSQNADYWTTIPAQPRNYEFFGWTRKERNSTCSDRSFREIHRRHLSF